MAFLVPKFTLQNYTALMGKEYQGSTDWWSGTDIIRLLCVPGFREKFAGLDARRLSTDITVGPNETVVIGGKSMKLKDCIIAIKLLLPTLRCCAYYFWNVGQGGHTGIDIILPKNTPIFAFQGGKVTRIKVRNGVTKNEGNCVVVQDDRGYFRGYEHLERMDVRVGQVVSVGTPIGTCGKTGNATQYHLHLQVDLPKTTPNPHRSSDTATIQQKTIDPIRALRAAFSSFKDLPYEAIYQDAVGVLVDAGYLQGAGGFLFPERVMQRYEIALMLHRLLKKLKQYEKLTKRTTTLPVYNDLPGGDPELNEAVIWLWQYGLMKGTAQGTFLPYAGLLYEELLALLGRSFFGLQDASGPAWYQTYLTYFQNHGYLVGVQAQIAKPILRKDCFLLLSKVAT